MKGMLAALLALAVVSGDTLGLPLTIDQAVNPLGTLALSLSPDGKHIAGIGYNGTNTGLLLYDTETLIPHLLSEGKRVTEGYWSFHKAPRAVTWVDNDLLAIDYGIEAESIRLDGKMVAELGEVVIGKSERNNVQSPNLLVYTDLEDGDVGLVNARTGAMKKFSYPGGKAIKWAFDRRGELRAVTLVNSAFWKDVSRVSNWYKRSADAEWEKLAEFAITEDYWLPMYAPDAPDTLVVSSRSGRDTYAIFSYDTKHRAIGELMAGHPTLDILDVNGIDQTSFEKVTTRGMMPQQIWFDPAWHAVQQSIDQALPGRFNRITGNPKGMVLVDSSSDVDPGSWYLLDTTNGKMRLVTTAKPKLADADMRPMETFTYAAADGLSIPAFLTRPAGKPGATPLVVLIHGGPTARDYWGWNTEVQILAAHGYAVFQPQFRGSSGFGRRFMEAGFGQWGLAMQDDITAGVEYLIKQGIADPKRICIAGASYGGYAALWGLVKTPDLYQCGVSFAGVSDIEFMFRDHSDRTGNKATRELMLAWIGDARSNKERFDEVSPLKHADRIKAPVLIMHGKDDVRVPIAHGEKMKNALEAQHKEVQWLTFEEEGHGLQYVRNEVIYYNTLLEFFDKYIGVSKATPAP
ncbi:MULTISPECIES: S9 family peptidase [unclassified Duganella]|uniref:alpha/beta hydrolase family protein n=1 Tax=unclassified Duganella TaxID=2636909 RepID=UPI000E34F4DF|nr:MULTISPECIES: S9 family peptidase [unclassified Duganella]RFP15899.1 S9 family peptidase [Duganella sp. BJB475]RFP32937.1 S9 family peptidase [Duganella sp. BJB476]